MDNLRFIPDARALRSLTMPTGESVAYYAYEGIPYVGKAEDPKYQTLNFYVPVNPTRLYNGIVPILFRTYSGGYMASTAKTPAPADSTGRALKEGFALCIPGNRGWNSKNKGKITGAAPAPILDLKAAIRFLRHNASLIPASADYIFTNGTSSGGALSALLGVSGNQADYEADLRAMGAADAPDNVFAAICYCPITDLNHADCEYEWLYGCTNKKARGLDISHCAISDELAELAPDYIDSLKLALQDGSPLNSGNYKKYIGRLIIESAHRALEAGADIPDNIGLARYIDYIGPLGNSGRQEGTDSRAAPVFGAGVTRLQSSYKTDFISGIDLDAYLNYIASTTKLKIPPAFDAYGVLNDAATPENSLFGNAAGEPANFTDFSLRKRTGDNLANINPQMAKRVKMMNAMAYINPSRKEDQARHWYIRVGSRDRDTSFLVPINLATKLQMAGLNVDFALAWNRPHSGDYNLDDLFGWIGRLMRTYA